MAQHTEDIVHAGVRLDPLIESAKTHESIEIYITGLGSTQTVSLTGATERDETVWLGELPSQEHYEVTITAHFPFSAGNETQKIEVPFEVTCTAQELAPANVPGETDDRSASE